MAKAKKKRIVEEKLKNTLGENLTWASLQTALRDIIEEVCPEKPPVKKPWITNECWRLIEENEQKRGEEMRRRVLRVSWTERRTNEWVRERVGVSEEHGLLQEVRRRMIRKYRHWSLEAKRRELGDSIS